MFYPLTPAQSWAFIALIVIFAITVLVMVNALMTTAAKDRYRDALPETSKLGEDHHD